MTLITSTPCSSTVGYIIRVPALSLAAELYGGYICLSIGACILGSITDIGLVASVLALVASVLRIS